MRRPDDGQLLVDVLLVLAWAGWAAFAVTVARRNAWPSPDTASHPTLHGLGGLQPYAGRLLATAALLLPAGTTIALYPAPEPSHPLAAADRTVADRPFTPDLPSRCQVHRRQSDARPHSHCAGCLTGIHRRHDPTGERDTLWSIAARHLGNPLRWNDIAALNYGHTQPDGGTFTDPALIRPGWQLQLPADATGLTPPRDTPTPPQER